MLPAGAIPMPNQSTDLCDLRVLLNEEAEEGSSTHELKQVYVRQKDSKSSAPMNRTVRSISVEVVEG
jgi:hypothetical protein